MDARETWQALQARLTNARAALEAGDRTGALAEISAALDIDPDFLAAHSLRDQILAAPDAAPTTPVVPSASARSAPSETSNLAASGDGYARFERRARRRRVDRRLDSTIAALESGQLKAAATALDEVIELDPNLPELPELTARFDALRRRAAWTRRGSQLVAAAVFVVTLLVASLRHDSTSLISRPMIAAAPLVSVQLPGVAVPPEATEVGTGGDLETAPEPAVPPRALERSNEPVDVVPAAMPPAETPEVVAPVSSPMPSPNAAPEDDSLLVKHALQRYRTAYDSPDAQSAQAVWPAVNQAGLAGAFDGLESQSLTFDLCEVRISGESATANCLGSARYVPKVGSGEPRIEPRVWNFSLQKAGNDWKIESARIEP